MKQDSEVLDLTTREPNEIKWIHLILINSLFLLYSRW